MSRKDGLARVKLVLDFVVLSGGSLLSKLVGFVAFGYLARTIGPEAYGSIEYVTGQAVFFTMIIDFGLGPIGVRELSRSDAGLRSLVANIPFARLGVALLCIIAMLLSAKIGSGVGHDPGLVLLFALSLLGAPFRLEWLLQAKEMMASAAGAQIIRMLMFTACVMFFVHSAGDLLTIGWIEIAAAAVTTFYFLATQQFRITPLSFRVSIPEATRLLRQGASVGGGQMVSALNIYAPLFLVANLGGATAAAWFGASHRIVVSLWTFSYIYHFNLYPVMARRYATDTARLKTLVEDSFRVIGWVSIGGALGLTLLAKELMVLGFGPEFEVAAPALAILVWILPCTLLAGHARWLAVAAEKQQYVFFAQLAGTICILLVGYPLVSRLDATGAALTMLVGSFGIWGAAHWLASSAVRALPSTLLLLRPALLAAALYFATSAVDINRWITASLAGLVYVSLAPILDPRLWAAARGLAAAKSETSPSQDIDRPSRDAPSTPPSGDRNND